MGKHKGDPNENWPNAVKSAADKAFKDAGPGNYTLHTEEVDRPGASPIRDYIVTLDGPN
jgi:hypothetical protein